MESLTYLSHSAYEWFWDDRFWLPGNISWSELQSTDHVRYPNSNWDTVTPIPIAITILLLRMIFEKYIATPIGRAYELKETRTRYPPENAHLEQCFRRHNRLPPVEVLKVSKEVGWSKSRIEWWFRLRRNQNRPPVLKKFNESCWKFVYYLSAFVYGLVVLSDKPWFYDTIHCWQNYPFHPLLPEIYWYYQIEAGFYLSLTISHFSDTKRKDFYQMFIHHITTLLLLYFSWSCNMIRIGSLVLVLHDAADWLMEGAKMAKYCQLQVLCDTMFAIFTVTWFVTRLVLYPVRVIYPSMTKAHRLLNMTVLSAYYIYNSLLIVLQIMHVIWFYMIVRIAYFALVTGKVQKDDRSSSDESDSDVSNGSNGKSKGNSNGKSNGKVVGENGDVSGVR